MSTCIKNSLLLLITALGSILAGQVSAQTFTNLYSFTGSFCCGTSDGALPFAGLTLSGNMLYGTTGYGGSSGGGTIFAINTDGTGYTNLHTFASGGEGAIPHAGLTLSGNTLYGTTENGGSSGNGTIFAINIDGTGFTTLYNFTNLDGANPDAGLILSGNTLYGVPEAGGSSSNGTIFAINTDGTGFTNLHTFAGYPNDGANPSAELILSSNILYGTTENGGSSGTGMVFAVNTDGTGFTTLYNFTAARINSSGVYTNSAGASPEDGLVLSGTTLYGTAEYGGSSGNGTIFAINTDGTGFTNLHNFTSGGEGANPHAGLILSGNTLYGTTENGGSSGNGTIFAIKTNGTGFTTLYSFTAVTNNQYAQYTNSDGANPWAGLTLSGNTLYGTTFQGGSSGSGTVFSLSLPTLPQLTISLLGANVILTWTTNATGFILQSTTNLISPIWTTDLPAPVVDNGQNMVTNPISGTQQSYRLSQ